MNIIQVPTSSNDFVIPSTEVQSSKFMNQTEKTDFELQSMEEQKKRLNYFTEQANKENVVQEESKIFTNLSLAQIFENFSNTIINIINELLDSPKTASGLDDIIYIFVKDDRLIYLGLLLIIISIAIYIIRTTAD